MLARWPGTLSRILSAIQRAAQTVLGVYFKSTCSRDTSAFSALEVLNDCALYTSTHSLTHSLYFITFYPRNAMLARVLAMTLCLCLSVSLGHDSVFYRNAWMNRAGFGIGAFLHLFYAVLKGNSIIFKNKGTFPWNFVPNCVLRKVLLPHIDRRTCYQLRSRKVDAESVMNWAVVSQLS